MNVRISVVALAAFAIGLVICDSGCSPAAKQDEVKPGPSSTAASSGPAPSEAKADFPAMTAEEFTKQFNTDESAAAKKYKDKSVLVSGVVAEKRGDPDQTGGIRLIVTGEKGEKPVNIRVELAMADAYTVNQFKKLKVGDSVKFTGTVWHTDVTRAAGKPGELELNFANIVK